MDDRPDIDQYARDPLPRWPRQRLTLRLIRTQGFGRVMIFCNTKHMCQRLCDEFQRAGAEAECIHGDIKQSLRERTMQRFHQGKMPILIATDVASRGIDVDDVDCVINYDIPRKTSIIFTASAGLGRGKNARAWHILW